MIALSLTVECLGINSENYLFLNLNKEYLNDFKNLISKRQHNDHSKLLFVKTEAARKSMAECIIEQADIFVIDSIPLEICRILREKRNNMGKESEQYSPGKVYCASPKKYFMVINYTVVVQRLA